MLYLLGLVPAGRGGVDGLPTFGPEPTASVEADGVVAVVIRVEESDFVGPGAERQLSDLSWIGPRAVRHQELLALLLQSGPVLPARFGTLFSGEEAVLNFLALHAATILGFLASVEGLAEWGVKGYLHVGRAEEALYAATAAAGAGTSLLTPGRRYLQERRLKTEAAKKLHPWLEETAASIAERLAPHARSVRRRSVLRGLAREEGEESVLSWAFLSDSASVSHLVATVRELNAELEGRGLRLEVSGPWPPYSFCPELPTPSTG